MNVGKFAFRKDPSSFANGRIRQTRQSSLHNILLHLPVPQSVLKQSQLRFYGPRKQKHRQENMAKILFWRARQNDFRVFVPSKKIKKLTHKNLVSGFLRCAKKVSSYISWRHAKKLDTNGALLKRLRLLICDRIQEEKKNGSSGGHQVVKMTIIFGVT